eukprot:g15892.t1
MENASLRLKLASVGEERIPVSTAVLTPDRETVEAAALVKPVFLEPEDPELCKPPEPRPEADQILLPGCSPAETEFRVLGIPSRATTTEFSDEEEEDDMQYMDAKSMQFDTLVSHRLQLITDTKLAETWRARR